MLPLTPPKKIEWRPDNPCPCESGRRFRDCCLQADGSIRKKVPNVLPRAPKTNHAQNGCYLSFTRDCSRDLSDEHYLSKSVLKALGNTVMVEGAPWLPEGEKRKIGIESLKAKILCSRHNNALSPLDEEAGRFFSAIRAAQDNISRRSLSIRNRWYLFSGELIELWMFKTLWGFFQSGSAAIGRERLVKTHILDSRVLQYALQFGIWPERSGLYANAVVGSRISGSDQVAFGSISDDSRQIHGCILHLAGLDFKLILDPSLVPWAESQGAHNYHPIEFIFRNRRRQQVITLTWQPGTEGLGIELTSRDG